MAEYRTSPPVYLFGDSAAALERMRRTADAAGCRIVSSALIEDDADSLRRCVPNAAALIELEGAAAPDALIALLDWAESEAEAGRRRSVVSADAALIDLVAARARHPDIAHLCAASEAERALAIVQASRPTHSRLNDIGRDREVLEQLFEEMARIAAMLAALSGDDGAAGAAAAAAGTAPGAEKDEPGLDAPYIRAMIRARRLRDQYFRGALFADPAWDMLLDLMAARLEEKRVAVSSLCIAAAVPATTALRWIKALTDRGVFVRAADPRDGRRVYIELADETARALAAYLSAVRRICPTAV
jgi:hypothetical protein